MNETLRVRLVRLSMVVFWVSVLAALLYAPVLVRVLSSRKSITVFAWPMEIDTKMLAQFEAETGIHVNMSYYESNTELYSKLRATNGTGYDLLIPTHYLIPRLLKHGYIKKLDKAQLPFFASLRPELMNHYYDPTNEYALPYFWGIVGLGVDTSNTAVATADLGWANIFDKKRVPGRIGMTDDPFEAVFMAAQYLFGAVPDQLNEEQIAAVKKLLKQQRAFVELYSDTRAGELLASHTCALVTGLSADIWKYKREYSHIGFKVPREGGLLLIDAMVISSATTKDDLVYQFINFLYRPAVLGHHIEKFAFCSPLDDPAFAQGRGPCLPLDELRKVPLFKTIMAQSAINDLWISVLAG